MLESHFFIIRVSNSGKTLLLTLMAMALLITACKQQGNGLTPCGRGPCPPVALIMPNLSFRVVDKTTGKDLFFGAGAAYMPSQLKFQQINNGLADSLHLRIDAGNQFFNIAVMPHRMTDTVTMNISGKPQDTLLFKIITHPCCGGLSLGSVLFNGEVVYTAQNGPTVAVLQVP